MSKQQRIALSDIMCIDLVDNRCQIRCKLPDQDKPCPFFSLDSKNYCTNKEGWRNRFPNKTYYKLVQLSDKQFYHILRERFREGIPYHEDLAEKNLYIESKKTKRKKWSERKNKGQETGQKGKDSDIIPFVKKD